MNGSLLFSSSSSLLPLAIISSPNDSIESGMNIMAIAYTIQYTGLKISAYTMSPIEIINISQLYSFNLSIASPFRMVC